MTNKTQANSTRAKIEAACQAVVKALDQKGEMSFGRLRRETHLEVHLLSWSIGWLAHEQSIEVIPKGASFTIARKATDAGKGILI